VLGIRSICMPTRGLRYPVDAQWRKHVREWLAAEEKKPDGISQTELARRAGIKGPTLNQLLSGISRHSHAVPSINKMVGLPPPAVAAGTIDEAELGAQLDAVMAQLDDDDRELVQQQLDGVLKMARKLVKRSGDDQS
jgi:transcriptional regulator with XRE-family HTH domain